MSFEKNDVKSKKSALEVMAGLGDSKDSDGPDKESGTVDCPACKGKGQLPEAEADKVEECLNADKDGEGVDDKPEFGSFSFKKKS